MTETLNIHEWSVHRPCPSCRHENSILIKKNHLICEEKDCEFSISFDCPICNQSLENAQWFNHLSGRNNTEAPIDTFECNACKSVIPLQKIIYLIDNGMVMDEQHRCTFCNGPTIHRSDMNLSHRCFFYPKCSGQIDLFGTVKESLIFLDFETTGLEAGRDSIIEIGAVKIDEDGYEHIFQTFINPGIPISEHITKITGITQDMVAEAPPLKNMLSKFIEFIGNCKIVAHNVDFDILWLLTNSIHYKLPLQDNPVICTLRWARQSGEPHCSLGALSKKYAIRHNNAHRALADAVTTKELFFIFEGFKKSPRPQLKLSEFRDLAQRTAEKYSESIQA